MSVSPQGPTDYPIGSLPPERFESLVFLLARASDPRVLPVRAHDHGLDARLPDAGGTLRGWQAKRYTGRINWSECRQSVSRAISFWRPPRITFCFPRDLSAAEQESFQTEVAKRFPEVRLDFWPGSELQRLVRDTEEGQRTAAWLFANPAAEREALLRAMAVGGELADTRQAAERQSVIQEFMDRDPHLHYNLVSRSPNAPVTLPAEQTLLSVTLVVSGQEVRLDASPRYPGALSDHGAVPKLAFTDDEAGYRDGRAARSRGWPRNGHGRPRRDDGHDAGRPAGTHARGGSVGAAEIVADAENGPPPEPPELRQPVLVRSGGAELGMVLTPGDEPEGWDGTLHAAAGGLEMFFSVRNPGDAVESRLDWRYTRGQGSGLEQLLAARLMLAALRGDLVEVVRPHDGHLLMSETIVPPEDAAEWEAELGLRDLPCLRCRVRGVARDGAESTGSAVRRRRPSRGSAHSADPRA